MDTSGFCRFAIGLLALSMAGAAFGTGSIATDATITAAATRQLETRALARRLLPPEFAAQAASHTVHELLGRPSGVTFALVAHAVGNDLCQRDQVHVALYAKKQPSSTLQIRNPSRWRAIALGTDCERIPATHYARIQPQDMETASAGNVLRWLDRLRRAAAEGHLAAPVACHSDVIGANPCAQGNLALMKTLPIERAVLIEPISHGEKGWRISIMPTGSGQLFWDTRLIPDPAFTYRVELRLAIPPPF